MRLPKLFVAIFAFSVMLLFPGLASAGVAGQFRVAIGNEATFSAPTLAAQHNSYIVLQAWEGARAEELKAANPELKVLVYQNLSAMAQGTSATGLSSTGVNFAEADSAHPDWFLTTQGGARIPEDGYSWLWMADIGNSGYQHQWTSNVLKLLANGPWDGVMMDDTNTTAKYHTNPAEIARYSNDAAYQAAVGAMLAYAGPQILAAGKLAVPNIGSWSEYPEVAEEWLHYVSGGVDEMFAKWSTTAGQGYRDESGWETQLHEIQSTERMGKLFLAITQAAAGDTQAIRYGWASTLLGADGHTDFMAAANYNDETWSSEYEAQIGEPTGTAVQTSGGAWERRFAAGLVVVNPTTSTVTVNLGGLYSGSGLTNVTTTTMAPNTALILHGTPAEAQHGGESGSGAKEEVGKSGPSSPTPPTSTSGQSPIGSGSGESGSTGTRQPSSSGSGVSATGTTGGTGEKVATKAPRHHHAGRSVRARTASFGPSRCGRSGVEHRGVRLRARRAPRLCASVSRIRATRRRHQAF